MLGLCVTLSIILGSAQESLSAGPSSTSKSASASVTSTAPQQKETRQTFNGAKELDEGPWLCRVSILMPDMHPGHLETDPGKILVSPETKSPLYPQELTFTADGQYHLRYVCEVAGSTVHFIGHPLDYFPPSYIDRSKNMELKFKKKMSLQFDVDFLTYAAGKTTYLRSFMHGHFVKEALSHKTVLKNWAVTKGSIVVAFGVWGDLEQAVDATIQDIWIEATTHPITVGGETFPVASDVTVDGEAYDGGYDYDQLASAQVAAAQTEDQGLPTGIIVAIVVACLIVLMIAGAVLTLIYKIKCAKKDEAAQPETRMEAKTPREQSEPLNQQPSQSEKFSERDLSEKQSMSMPGSQPTLTSGETLEGSSGCSSCGSMDSMDEAEAPATTSWPGLKSHPNSGHPNSGHPSSGRPNSGRPSSGRQSALPPHSAGFPHTPGDSAGQSRPPPVVENTPSHRRASEPPTSNITDNPAVRRSSEPPLSLLTRKHSAKVTPDADPL